MARDVALVMDARATLGEGPLWDERTRRLYWVDILEHRLHLYDPATRTDTAHDVGQRVSTVVLNESGAVWLAVAGGFARFDLAISRLEIVADPEADQPENRFNDGKCDPAGRFWAGTMHASATVPGKGSLYRLDPDLSVHTMLTGVSISNGIVWTADRRTMYYVDTIPRTITAFDYEDDIGSISHPRVVIEVPASMGMPDGMAIDQDGMLWIAHFFGAAVHRWNPHTGAVIDTIPLPVSNPTACAFAGDNLDELYITSARDSVSDERLKQEIHAGGLFWVRTGVTGTLTHRFKGV